MFKNFSIVEQNWLIKCLQELESTIANMKAQVDDAKRVSVESQSDLHIKKCRCKDLQLELEAKDQECQKQKGEMENLRKDLEKCQDEFKVRIQYDSIFEALDKMLSKQKHSKDIRGIGCDARKYSTSNDVSNKEIQFVSSSGENKR